MPEVRADLSGTLGGGNCQEGAARFGPRPPASEILSMGNLVDLRILRIYFVYTVFFRKEPFADGRPPRRLEGQG